MGAKAEIFYDAKQVRTSIPIRCIVCSKERILNWSEDYCQWICDSCMGEIPSNMGTVKFKRFKKKLLMRKYRQRGVESWTKQHLS